MTLATLFLALAATTPTDPALGVEPPDPIRPTDLERVHVVGASVSSGFGTRREFGATLQLAHVLDVALPRTTEVATSADEMMFLDPVQTGDEQVERAIEQEATTLVAVDFLFWYAYGVQLGEDARKERFDDGLLALEQFDGPIVLGDLPDVGYAVGGGMLYDLQVPERATLDALNAKLKVWAAERGGVHLVPLAKFLEGLEDADEVVVRGHRYAKPFETLLQHDRLHANVDGTVALTRLVLDSIVGVDELEGVTWDHDALRTEVTATYGPTEREPEPAGGGRAPEDRARGSHTEHATPLGRRRRAA